MKNTFGHSAVSCSHSNSLDKSEPSSPPHSRRTDDNTENMPMFPSVSCASFDRRYSTKASAASSCRGMDGTTET